MSSRQYVSRLALGSAALLLADVLFLLIGALAPGEAAAAEVNMKSGFRLQGRLGKIAGLTENPLQPADQAGEINNRLIVLVDDGLRRSFVCTYAVRSVAESEPIATTRINVRQRVADGRVRRVGMVGPIVRIEPFDKWGRRTFEMATADGNLKIIQGMTEITPLWTKVEGLLGQNPYQWDMRIATSSIPRSTLSAVLMSQINTDDVDQRRQIVKLYIESDRFHDAGKELEQMFEDFPELRKEMGDLARDLRQMSARRLFQEIELRQQAGQHHLANRMLSSFPDQGVASTMLGRVRESITKYQKTVAQGKQVVDGTNKYLEQVTKAETKAKLAAISKEIHNELNIHTLDRFADFLRLADSDKLTPEQKLSLAVSGWILGSGSGTENLAVSLNVVQLRDLVRMYLRSNRGDQRQDALAQMRALEGYTPGNIAKIIAHMKPPLDPPEPHQDEPAEGQQPQIPGMFQLTVPGMTGHADIHYHVQLPPEYDPYKRYPTIVTLNGSATTPQKQVDWWAGTYHDRLKMRMGQAARRGYIVIAPQWTKKHQRKYEFSAREHAAVLFSLRDAVKRFSIHTDRVFLSGHSMGGDAAWDIALAHPDLWAGVIPIVATTGKYIARYWENGENVPMYFVGGEMDGDRMSVNSRDLDRYLTTPGFDCVVVEYLGRGHEDFIDEIQRLFDWMDLHQRQFYPPPRSDRTGAPQSIFTVNSMRTWDNFFWWVEIDQFPSISVVPPVLFDDKISDARPVVTTAEFFVNNYLRVKTGANKVTVYLTPDMVDFDERVRISVNNLRPINDAITPKPETILEDVRTRGDRQRPFWAKVEISAGRR